MYVKPDDRKQVFLQLIPPLTQTLQGQGQAISLTWGRFCTVAQEPLRFTSWTHLQIPALAGLRGSPKGIPQTAKHFWSPQTHTHTDVQTFHVRLFMDRGKLKADSSHFSELK